MSAATDNHDDFGIGTSVKSHQQSFIFSIDLLPDEDLFTIVDLRIDDTFQRDRLERFRVLCRRLVPDSPGPTSPVEWHHLVNLFCAFQQLSVGRENKRNNRITSGKQDTPEVSAWFKKGHLPRGSRAYIYHDRSWQAVIIFDSISHHCPDLIRNGNSSSQSRYLGMNNLTLANRNIFSNGQMYSTSVLIDPNPTTDVFHQNGNLKHTQKSAGYEKKYGTYSSSLRKTDEFCGRKPDRVEIQPTQSFYGSSTRTYDSFEPMSSSNTSPTLSTTSFTTQLTSSIGNSPPDFPSKQEAFSQKNYPYQPSLLHQSKKRMPRKFSSESFTNSLVPRHEPKEFFTCRSLLGVERQLTAQQALLATASGLDLAKYKGDITTARIRDQLLPESENCSLRIIDIHPDITDKQLFQTIDTGKVYFYQRLPSKMGVHFTCAANLAFFDRRSAENFYQKCSGWPGIWLGGYRIKALWNRDKSSPPANGHISRVVTVYGLASLSYGKEQFLSRKGLESFFNSKFHFLLVDAVEWMIDSTTKAVRLEFGSARCQGQFARISLTRFIRQNNLHGILGVEYSADPCQERC
ncbi:hypothetical protein K3495_g3858 [Podosphaera aphanis]|nr:hypothetical protein K3495_g3858 [Podosphaera aphanis]